MSLNSSELRSYHRMAVERPRTTTWAPIMASECAMLADAVEIADSSARSHIECECLASGGNAEQGWQWDTTTADPDVQPIIQQELRYLEARGLLIRKEDAPHIVSFRTAA